VRAFVTGATGFVGSHLVEALIDRGDEVTSLVRSPAKAQRVFPAKKPRLFPGSLSDPAAVRTACQGADVVYHLAGLTAARNRTEFLTVNEGGTRAVVEAARDVAPNLKRFVQVSSLAAAGPTQRGRPLTEDAPSRPISDYGFSKLAGEQVVKAAGLPWTITRPPAVYGPRDVELRRVFSFARFGIRVVFGDGEQELSLIHVTDLVSALIHAATATEPGHTYFTAHPEIVTSRQFVAEVHAAVRAVRRGQPISASGSEFALGIPEWFARPALATTGFFAKLVGKPSVLSPDKLDEFYADAWSCSPAALEQDSGWQAKIPIAEGLKDTARWYRRQGLL
jgi:nucleoside-diphosphate-sugar epimerase